jgi:hypothetical protein
MDRKRVNGPELSVAPIEENIEKKNVFDSTEKRQDGRGIDDIRPICECLPGLSACKC